MPLLYRDVATLLRVNPPLGGFDDCAFQLRVLPLADVLDRFLTCWGHNERPPGSMSYDQHLAATGGPNDRVRAIADAFDFTRPVFAVAFSKTVLHERWKDPYPVAGAELVVTDGNHRLAALAIRRARGDRDRMLIGAFVCE